MSSPTGKRVLVVDDDEDIREALADALSVAGYEVTPAANGREALERLRATPHDLVVLDLMMPVMTGWEFRDEQLQDARIAHVPVIVVSAAHSPKAIAASATLPKPFDLQQILELAARLAGVLAPQ